MGSDRRGKRGSPKLPACPACSCAGLRPPKLESRRQAWFQVDGRVKVRVVQRAGGAVARKLAWVTCRRTFGYLGTCGWGWWSAHPDLVAAAERHPHHVLVARYAVPPGKRPSPGRPMRRAGWE